MIELLIKIGHQPTEFEIYSQKPIGQAILSELTVQIPYDSVVLLETHTRARNPHSGNRGMCLNTFTEGLLIVAKSLGKPRYAS